MTGYDQTRAWAEFAINVATEAHKNRGAETGHRDGYCLACAEIYRAVHTAKPVEKVDVHPATFDYGRYPPPPRWAIIPLTEAGVPGGGEPQPTTSTDNDGPGRARQMIADVTAEHARTWKGNEPGVIRAATAAYDTTSPTDTGDPT